MNAYLNTSFLRELSGNKIRVFFWDRDGVINKRMPPHKHITCWEQFEIIPCVYDAIEACNKRNIPIILITNQRCISIGTLSKEDFEEINNRMLQDFKLHGVHIDGIYFCPHDDKEGCSCRKPKAGMLIEAETDLKDLDIEIDKEISWMIGDEDTDVEAGNRFGINSLKIHVNFVGNIKEAVTYILQGGHLA